jgi:hypothetical protein
MSNTGNYKPDISKAIAGLVSILAIRYTESSYAATVKSIQASGLPVVYVDRNPKGIGSLAEAINRGMKQMTTRFVFIVTNVTFDPLLPLTLVTHIHDADIIHPSFNSDHPHLQVIPQLMNTTGFIGGVGFVPFVEFTAPLVNREKWIPVDESMPYWGFDLDHGWRVWENGGKVLCDYTCTIGHTYIRNIKHGKALNGDPIITQRRLQRRRQQDEPTKRVLKRKYGVKWNGVLFHKSASDIGRFINDVVRKKFPNVMQIGDARVWIEESAEIPVKVFDDIKITHLSLNSDGTAGFGYLIKPQGHE